MKITRLRLGALVPSLLLLCQSLSAADVDAADEVKITKTDPQAEFVGSDEIIISATRLSGDVSDQPYALYHMTADQIEFRQTRTLIDALHATPGIAIQRTAPNQASPFIRGLTGEQTLLLFDGVRFNHSMMRPGPNQYAALLPDSSIGSVDIILGSASTVLGSDGLTGAIDFQLSPAGRQQQEGVGGYADLQYGTADNGGTLAAGLDGRQGDWAWTAEVSAQSYDNLRAGKDSGANHFGSAAGDQEVPNTAYDQQAFNTRLLYDGLNDHSFEFAAGSVQQDDAPRPDGYFENTNKSSKISRFFPQQDFSYIHGRHYWTPDSEHIQEIKTTLWYHQFDEEQVREDLRSGGTQYRRRQYQNSIATVGIDMQIQYLIGADHSLTSGVTLFQDGTDTSYQEFRSPTNDTDPNNASQLAFTADEENARATVPDDSTYQGLGIYTQDQWRIDDQWSLLTGLRYSRYAWNADVTERNFAVDVIDNNVDALTASIRAAWNRDENWHLFMGLSQGFRAPNLTNLTGADDIGSSGTFFAGNPDLDPERSLSYEIGLRYDSVDAHTSYVALNIFYTTIDDIIQRVFIDIDNDSILDPVVMNGEDARLHGFEFHFDQALPYYEDHGTLSVYSVNNYVDAEEKVPQSDGSYITDNISRANRLFGVVGSKFEFHSRWWGAAQMRWSDAYDKVAASDANDVRLTILGHADGSLSGYAVFDLKAGWSSNDGKHAYNLAIENILNKTYRDIGSGADATGLNIAFAMEMKF